MKKLTNHTWKILLLALLCAACDHKPISNDKDLIVLIDQSDPLKITPNADEVTAQAGLKEDMWQGIKVTIDYISDKDVNASKVVTLEKANRLSGNSELRAAQAIRFKKELRTALSCTGNESSLDHSIIYRTIAKQVNSLSSSTATARVLLVYSDLMENSDLSFYDRETLVLLRTHPERIKQQFEKSAMLRHLSGMEIWFLYEPASYMENSTYMSIANIYKQLLESKGATVHIEKTLNL
jgi:hypothetical protein